MAARAGIETAYKILQGVINKGTYQMDGIDDAHYGAQNSRELQTIVLIWPSLSPEIKRSLLALANAALSASH
jgi:hypothetical protein